MKILIVDDEAPARQRLQRLIGAMDDHTVVGEASNGIEAIALFNQTRPDLVLLDIRMPGMDGLETAKHLVRAEHPPAIIFTTAYDDHALEAFQAHATDYLLKPIRAEHLQEALAKAARPTRAQMATLTDLQVNDEPTGDPNQREHLCIRERGNLILIPIANVYYLLAEHKYVDVCHTEGHALIEESLVSLEGEFGQRFLRIHRNCLIAASQLVGLEKNKDGSHSVKLRDADDRLDVSRRHLPHIRKLLKG